MNKMSYNNCMFIIVVTLKINTLNIIKMNKILVFLVVILAIITGKLKGQEIQTSLANALRDSIISVSIQGMGMHEGECMDLYIQNHFNAPVRVKVNSGLKLISKDSFLQNMYITKSFDIRIAPKGKTMLRIFAMCCQVHKSSPRKGRFYKIGKLASGTILRLIKVIENSNMQNDIGQKALWVVTDNGTKESLLYNPVKNESDRKTIELLRQAGAEGFVLKQAPVIIPKDTFKVASINKFAYAAIRPVKISNATQPSEQSRKNQTFWEIYMRIESSVNSLPFFMY